MLWKFDFSTHLQKTCMPPHLVAVNSGIFRRIATFLTQSDIFLITFFLGYSTIQKGCVEK